jgi:malonate-semialdehyde dehydrogenase (acetylating)/methylmalonate-semialdehyde dehydrogenase
MTSMQRVEHWIDGAATAGVATRTAPIYDPARAVESGRVLLAEAADVDAAVDAASKAQVGWARLAPLVRARVMFAMRDLLVAHTDELAALISAEHGKVLSDARGEVARGIEVVEFACGIPHLLKGEYSDGVSTGVDAYSLRQPLGVVAGITPFNFPIMVPLWMHPIAIACGNAFVLKPSEQDPSTSLLVARLYQQAGLPDGVYNVVQGDRVAVEAVLDHPGISGVSFVGSTAVA